MTRYSRGQQAQIAKRIRLRGGHPFTLRDRKCIVCGHQFRGPACEHSISENQEVLEKFSKNLTQTS